MADTCTVRLQLAYDNTDETRFYSFECDATKRNQVKPKIKAINASLAGGTDAGLSDFFISNDGNPLVEIAAATITSAVDYPIDLGGE